MTLWIDNRLIEAQKPIIQNLEHQIDELLQNIEFYKIRLPAMRDKATFYLDMQCRIIDNPHIMEVWQAFIMLIKFTLDDNVKGITTHD